MSIGHSIGQLDGEILILYDTDTLDITGVQWYVKTNMTGEVIVWDNDIDPTTPIFQTIQGEGSGTEPIPEGYQLVEVTDSEGTRLEFPPNITYILKIWDS